MKRKIIRIGVGIIVLAIMGIGLYSCMQQLSKSINPHGSWESMFQKYMVQDGSVDVKIDNPIWTHLDQYVNWDTVDDRSVKLYCGPVHNPVGWIPGLVNVFDSGSVQQGNTTINLVRGIIYDPFVFSGNCDLDPLTQCVLHIAGVQDQFGNVVPTIDIHFTTADVPAGYAPDFCTDYILQNGDVSEPLFPERYVNLDGPFKGGSLSQVTVKLFRTNSPALWTGTFVSDTDDEVWFGNPPFPWPQSFILSPDHAGAPCDLDPESSYTLHLEGITRANNQTYQTTDLHFTTGPLPQGYIPDFCSDYYIYDGITGVGLHNTWYVDLGQPVPRSSLNTDNIKLYKNVDPKERLGIELGFINILYNVVPQDQYPQGFSFVPMWGSTECNLLPNSDYYVHLEGVVLPGGTIMPTTDVNFSTGSGLLAASALPACPVFVEPTGPSTNPLWISDLDPIEGLNDGVGGTSPWYIVVQGVDQGDSTWECISSNDYVFGSWDYHGVFAYQNDPVKPGLQNPPYIGLVYFIGDVNTINLGTLVPNPADRFIDIMLKDFTEVRVWIPGDSIPAPAPGKGKGALPLYIADDGSTYYAYDDGSGGHSIDYDTLLSCETCIIGWGCNTKSPEEAYVETNLAATEP